ncbi:rRNA-processing protein [Cyanidiococcus yangmingshanensis]|uniref:rRNA-processing protein n=1 Tax=Cyanidiococcus yangmingshanensis TaxID=2690220 RepID=A0A7J7IRL9_9RHOD|nr:rRNA-processing protein [Cyanidiococcus yangmingshanensis]
MITTLFWVPRGQAAAAVACSTQDPGQEHVPPDVLVEGDPTLPQVVMSESESSEVGLDQVLSFPGEFSEGRDPNLSAQAVDWEQLEAEDERFQDTDWLIFTGRLYADDSCGFEVCVLERPDIEPGKKPSSFAAIDSNVYIHHDGVLAAAPLSSAFTDYGGRCIAAVGTYAPTVELWDLVSTNAVEPLLTLGSAAPGESWNRTIVTGNGDDVAVQVTQKSRKRKRQSMGEAGLPRVDQGWSPLGCALLDVPSTETSVSGIRLSGPLYQMLGYSRWGLRNNNRRDAHGQGPSTGMEPETRYSFAFRWL